MADFPLTIYSPRTKVNRNGIIYIASKSSVLFAEDVTKLDAEVVALETKLEGHTWNDIYIPLAGAKIPASHMPSWATFFTNLNSYTFALDDYADVATAEILHGYKEGTDIKLHVHFVTNGLNNATARKVKYRVYYSWGDIGEAMSAEASLTAEYDIPANCPNKTHFLLDLGAVVGTGYKIGSIFKMRVMRIAGTGVEPAVDPFVEMIGIHYQADFIGSTNEMSK